MMSSTPLIALLVVVMSGIVCAYVWPRAEARLEKMFVATLGALVGSLVGRVFSDPRWVGHLFYLVAGALVFSAADWMRRKLRSTR